MICKPSIFEVPIVHAASGTVQQVAAADLSREHLVQFTGYREKSTGCHCPHVVIHILEPLQDGGGEAGKEGLREVLEMEERNSSFERKGYYRPMSPKTLEQHIVT